MADLCEMACGLEVHVLERENNILSAFTAVNWWIVNSSQWERIVNAWWNLWSDFNLVNSMICIEINLWIIIEAVEEFLLAS